MSEHPQIQPYKHALIVGGTGMLQAASREIARQAKHCSVLGRNPERLQALKQQAHIHPFQVDYSDPRAFEKLLEDLAPLGPIDLALLWIHRSGQAARQLLYAHLQAQQTPCRLIELHGSAAAAPGRSLENVNLIQNVNVIQVILGFKIEGAYSRWLTHAEISQGALDALKCQNSPLIVGQLRPWSARPA